MEHTTNYCYIVWHCILYCKNHSVRVCVLLVSLWQKKCSPLFQHILQTHFDQLVNNTCAHLTVTNFITFNHHSSMIDFTRNMTNKNKTRRDTGHKNHFMKMERNNSLRSPSAIRLCVSKRFKTRNDVEPHQITAPNQHARERRCDTDILSRLRKHPTLYRSFIVDEISKLLYMTENNSHHFYGQLQIAGNNTILQ